MKRGYIEGRGTIVKTGRRVRTVLIAFFLFLVFLVSNLIKLQVGLNSYYTRKVYDQITTTSTLKAQRGKIYDSNMKLLATTKTVWRVFISTRDIKKAEKETGINYTDKITLGLSSILGISSYNLREKIKNTSRNYLACVESQKMKLPQRGTILDIQSHYSY